VGARSHSQPHFFVQPKKCHCDLERPVLTILKEPNQLPMLCGELFVGQQDSVCQWNAPLEDPSRSCLREDHAHQIERPDAFGTVFRVPCSRERFLVGKVVSQRILALVHRDDVCWHHRLRSSSRSYLMLVFLYFGCSASQSLSAHSDNFVYEINWQVNCPFAYRSSSK
jgi:hypothetical protein